MTQTHNLFSPIKVGSNDIKTRVVLAPLTRARALPGHVPSDLSAEYYAQRAAPGTLLITEATYISPESIGFPEVTDGYVPGIWNEEQIEGWKKIFKAVHDRGSKVYMQLWDIGRVAWYSKLQRLGNYVPRGPSPITNKGGEDGEHLKPLSHAEVKDKVALYVTAAKNAIAAGADGVEIHSANGYLPDTFLRSGSNQRIDEYGGSVENRARFSLEIVDSITEAIGADKTAIRLSPWSTFQDIEVNDTETPEQFTYLFERLQKRADEGKELAYIHVVEPRLFGTPQPWESNEPFRKIWKGNFIRAGGYDRESAIEDADKADNTLIAFGRHFIANPDLVERLKKDQPLNKYDRSTFYVPGPKGYTDYPVYK